jgi:glycosyltransferase involved in cell wall biosynthesis
MKIAHLNCQGSGVGEYRHWNPSRALARRGHEVRFTGDIEQSVPPAEAQAKLLHLASWADVIHTGFSADLDYIALLAAARNYAKVQLGKNLPILTDCDDDLLNVPPYNLAFKAYHADREVARKALWQFRNSDAVTVTTPWLKELYQPYNHNIVVLPNCVDPELWKDLPPDPRRASSEDVRIMFAGGLGRRDDLNLIEDAIAIVMRARPQVRLFFIAMMPDWAAQWSASPSDPLTNRVFYMDAARPRTYRRMACHLGIDIVLAPVVENEFNRGKSSIKVLESPFIGGAAVCSDFETYAEVPTDCVLKASTTYEWKESLLALVDDPGLRARKVARCKEWVLEERAIDRQIHLWERAYEEALTRPVIGSDAENMKTGLVASPPPGFVVPTP